LERADFETELAPICAHEGLGVIPYYPLAGGFLTGKYRTQADLAKSPRGGGAKKYLDERGLRVLAALDRVAAGHEATPAQVALAWLLAKPVVSAPIVSATTLPQLEELLRAATLTLDQVAIDLLDQASA
jgi:aryl-alcohol dehydrogenase-like predicted oxidoreductase